MLSGVASVCKRTLVFLLLSLGTVLLVPLSASANGVITVTTPLNGATVSVPFDVHFTYSGSDTYTKLWIDGTAIVSDHNGSTFDYTVTSLAAGQHTLALQAHDASSNTTVTLDETITVSSALTITPASPTLAEGAQQLFSSGTVAANWTLSASGSGTPDGNLASCSNTTSCTFTAGVVAGTAIVTATATDGSASGQTTITVAPLAITPSNPNVAEGQPITLNANAPVTWSATGDGTVPSSCTTTASTSCVFTANATGVQAVVTAAEITSAVSAQTTVTVGLLTLTPQNATTVENQTQTFTANAPIASSSWSATCGNIQANQNDPTQTTATFTAPGSTAGSPCTITASDSSNASAQASDTITAPPPPTGLSYTTWKNGNDHTGQQPNETALTPATVCSPGQCPANVNKNANTFGLKFTDNVDGQVYAQPLYVFGLTIPNQGTHNVVFVATEHDSVYAFDADAAGSPLWQVSLLAKGETTASPSSTASTIGTEIGITGTPVIDMSATPNPVLYVVAESDANGTYIHRLHALDVTTGEDIVKPAVITGLSGFSSKEQLQRPALILASGNVYVSFGSEGDKSPWHGWILAFQTNTLTHMFSWNSSPGGNGGGIWGGGGGLSADTEGNLYASTGNGNWDGTSQYSMSWVKLNSSLQVVSFWTPYNQASLSKDDEDLGSGAPVLVSIPSVTNHPNELIGCGKPTPVYVVDRDHMDGLDSGGSDSQIIQSLSSVVGGGTSKQRQYHDHCFMTPAYFNGTVYFIGNNDFVKAFSIDPTKGTLSKSPTSQGGFPFLFPGGQPVTSSNGSKDGIVWAVDYNSYYLHAYDASDLTNELYRSSSVGFAKWVVPTVVNGKVYVGSQKKLSVFGLF